jgi:cell division protein FtsB
MATRPARRRTERPDLRVVPASEGPTPKDPTPRGRARRRRGAVTVVLLAVVTVFGVVALQAWMAQNGFKEAKLERELTKQTEEVTLLRARVAQLSTPRRIAEEASRLGLVADPRAAYLHSHAARDPSDPWALANTKKLITAQP